MVDISKRNRRSFRLRSVVWACSSGMLVPVSGLAYFLRLNCNILVAEWLSSGGISVRPGGRILLDLFADHSFQMSA